MKDTAVEFIRRYLIGLLACLLSFSSCSPMKDCHREDIVCAGLVTDTGGVNDHGLNEGAWQGLQDALSLNILQEAKYIESIDHRDYEKNIQYFAGKEYDIVLTIGMGQRRQTEAAAIEYPGIIFLGLDQAYDESPPNLLAIDFPEDRMGYFAGGLAASLTATGVVGAVCDDSDFESMWEYCEGFRQGAQYCGDFCSNKDKTITALTLYRNDGNSEYLFNDPDWGADAAHGLIRRGADIIFGAGGGTGMGALQAAAAEGVYAIGAEQDQWFSLPDARPVLITSVYPDGRTTVREGLKTLLAQQSVRGDLTGYFTYSPFYGRTLGLPEYMTAGLEVFFQALQSGLINTGVSPNPADLSTKPPGIQAISALQK